MQGSCVLKAHEPLYFRGMYRVVFACLLLLSGTVAFAQGSDAAARRWGPNDTVLVSAIFYNGESMPYKELENVYVTKLSPEELAKVLQKYNRLRNAVYVTYPYARVAGYTLNQIAEQLRGVTNKAERRRIIKSREAELRKQFAEPLTNLSVYQGRVLMKLINRQTGNNCYDIIKEYRGGFNARFYQTVAFFFGSSLKQDYEYLTDATDRQIESIVKEIDGVWYNNPYRPGVQPGK